MIKSRFYKADSNYLKSLKKIAFGASLGCLASSAYALHFEPTDDFTIDIDTTLTYGAMWRVEDMDNSRKSIYSNGAIVPVDQWSARTPGSSNDALLSDDYLEAVELWNSDDGNRNFEKGDQVSSRVSAITDMDFNYQNVGLFLRTQIFYDSVYFEETSWDAEGWDYWEGPDVNCGPGEATPNCGYVNPASINNLVASPEHGEAGRISDPKHFSEAVKDIHGFNARFLDAYVYGTFDVGDRLLDLRVGRQVISWGESLMLQGGISFAQNRIDAAAATSPGVELKEIFLPTGSVYGQLDLTDSLTMEAYWMYEWLPSELMATGSYFSAQDFLEGSDIFLLNSGIETACMFSQYDTRDNGDVSCGVYDRFAGGIPPNFGLVEEGWEHNVKKVSSFNNAMRRAADVEPDKEYDQFGVAFRYLLDNGSEFGFYFMRYHDRFPSVWAMNNGAQEFLTPVQNGFPLSVVGSDDYRAENGVTSQNTEDVTGMNTRYYTLEYKEAIRLYGLTLNTVIGDVQMGFEITYRPNQPVVPGCTDDSLYSGSIDRSIDLDGDPNQVTIDEQYAYGLSFESSCKDPSARYFAAAGVFDNPSKVADIESAWGANAGDKLLGWPVRAEVFTANIGTTMVIPPTPLWDTGIFVAELGGVYVGGFEDDDLRDTSLGGFTKKAFGVSGIFLPEWKNVMEGIDLTAPVFVNYTIDGSFSYFSYNDKALWYSVGLNAVYLSNTTFGVTYSSFHGAKQMWRDRDNIAFNIKYTF